MPSYHPPLRDMHFVLHDVLGVMDVLKDLPAHAELDAETMAAVLEEGGKFAADILTPLNAVGDAQGCHLNRDTHEVKTPEGFKAAYEAFVAGGWPALSCDPAYGGQGLPIVVNQCFYEMLNSANQAWTMYPGLTHGAYECLHAHGTEVQKQTYLPKMTRHFGQIGLLLYLCSVSMQTLIGAVGQARVHGPGLVGAVEHFIKALVHHNGQALATIRRVTAECWPAPGNKGLVGRLEALGSFDLMGVAVEVAALRVAHSVERRQNVGGKFSALFQHGGHRLCIELCMGRQVFEHVHDAQHIM